MKKAVCSALILGNRKQQIKKYKEYAGKEEDYIKSNMKYWAIRIDTPFNIVIPENFLTNDLIKKAEALRERICNSIFADLNINSIDSDRLNQIFASDDRVKIRQFLREYLTELHLKAANYFNSMEDLNKYIKDINGEIEEKQLQYDMLGKVDATNTETFSSRRNFSMHYEYFHSHFEMINKKIEAGKRTKKGIYITKFGSVNPQILVSCGRQIR